jgi:uncharacterized protein YlzI (FlbEa/FlbD family)
MASKKVVISEAVEEIIGRYFEEYRTSRYGSDLQKRAFNYSQMRSALTHIDAFFDDIYIKNGKKYIDIEGICTVKFLTRNNQTEVLVENIYFKNP